MPADNNRVRRLDDARSDKTGTLTTNRVTVMQIGIDGQGFTSASQTPDEMSESTRHVFCNGVCINSTAEILPPVDSLSTWGTRPSVPVLMQLVRDCGVDHLNARHETRSQADVQQQEEARVCALQYQVRASPLAEVVLAASNNGYALGDAQERCPRRRAMRVAHFGPSQLVAVQQELARFR
ncbi:hypothetical protein PF006_g19381 [Phytophthora fragariae]|uniref:Uncharacterized protein n=1 Tax=Phytophthora fragariae TaxID=53985 RepID=A0A6A3SDR3_9STRA|nr:hypothetical protein PF006_g19381 [Phytophthora fragariae]